MALRTKVKLFITGREIYIVTLQETGIYKPEHAVVDRVNKGSIELQTDAGNVLRMNANDRSLCFTRAECAYICDLLNTRKKRS